MAQSTVVDQLTKGEETFKADIAYLSKKNWKEIITLTVISGIVATLTVLIIKAVLRVPICYLTGSWFLSFFTVLLLIGNPFLQNIAIISLSGIFLTIVLSVFVFIAYDYFSCKDSPSSLVI